jgi:16S rRNA (uracil1498-N3)-methyltransferase
MFLFFTQTIENKIATLTEEESIHCIKVLRKKVGDEVQFTDAKGNWYIGKITLAHPKKCQIEILEITQIADKPAFHLHLAIAPTKNIDRMEWLVEKLVEIGIDEITFLLCEHSERKQLNISRLEKIALGAMKQSLKTFLPQINEIKKFNDFVISAQAEQKLLAYLPNQKPQLLKNQLISSPSYCVLIGPEGDFSPLEISLALEKGFAPVSLGASRLRTETAALVACHTIQLWNEK